MLLQTIAILGEQLEEVTVKNCPELTYLNGERISIDLSSKKVGNIRLRMIEKKEERFEHKESFFNSPYFLIIILLIICALSTLAVVFFRPDDNKRKRTKKIIH
jgi:hypothetical protein